MKIIGNLTLNTESNFISCNTQEVMGTNPLCLAAPAKNGDSFVLDMATTAVALGKVRLTLFPC